MGKQDRGRSSLTPACLLTRAQLFTSNSTFSFQYEDGGRRPLCLFGYRHTWRYTTLTLHHTWRYTTLDVTPHLHVKPHLHVTLYPASLSSTTLLVTTCSIALTDSWHLAPPKSAAVRKTFIAAQQPRNAAVLALGEGQMLNKGWNKRKSVITLLL